MPKIPGLTSQEAEVLLSKDGFELVRSKGSDRIYMKGKKRIVIPFHANKILHPKITKQIVGLISPSE